MAEFGGLPPAILIAGGVYLLTLDSSKLFWIGIALIILGSLFHYSYINKKHPN